jgi:hypothetical protein
VITVQAIILSAQVATSADSAQLVLQDGGRLLLMVSMALFLSYLLFMVGAVTVSGLAGAVRSHRTHSRRARRGAHVARDRRQPAWRSGSASELRDVHA